MKEKLLCRRAVTLHAGILKCCPGSTRYLSSILMCIGRIFFQLKTDILIVGIRGIPTTTAEVGYIVEQFKPLFSGRNLNPGTIRQSVIANWLNEKKFTLEMVQLMAGHRWISSTSRYRHNSTDEKRILINRFDPNGVKNRENNDFFSKLA